MRYEVNPGVSFNSLITSSTVNSYINKDKNETRE